MKAKVCKDRCFGCTACTSICSDMFTMDDDGLAKVIPDIDENGFAEVIPGCEEDVTSAIEACPGSAIESN